MTTTRVSEFQPQSLSASTMAHACACKQSVLGKSCKIYQRLQKAQAHEAQAHEAVTSYLMHTYTYMSLSGTYSRYCPLQAFPAGRVHNVEGCCTTF